ncbi:hypothetical protein ABHN11_12875 [Brevibacillus centrosporus]|uniref:hypothetical protein n=1 Tax=Brevibacillus centrosporus TaxID=54910 RepID=UPI003D2303A1
MREADWDEYYEKELIKIINFYEKRYGGAFEEVAKIKGDPSSADLDWIWCREGNEWRSCIREFTNLEKAE